MQEEKIRELAYQKWVQAGRPYGNDGKEYWQQAEDEHKSKSSSRSTKPQQSREPEPMKTAAKKSSTR